MDGVWNEELLSKNVSVWLEEKTSAHPEWYRGIVTRIRNCLLNMGIPEKEMTISWLLTQTEAKLLRQPELGRKTLRTIVYFLKEDGLALNGGYIEEMPFGEENMKQEILSLRAQLANVTALLEYERVRLKAVYRALQGYLADEG